MAGTKTGAVLRGSIATIVLTIQKGKASFQFHTLLTHSKSPFITLYIGIFKETVDSLNRTLVVAEDKLSSSQLLDFNRSEEKGDLLYYLLALRCSMCLLRSLSMSNMPYCSMQMPIGWNGVSMLTERCSVHMPIVITNFEVRAVK